MKWELEFLIYCHNFIILNNILKYFNNLKNMLTSIFEYFYTNQMWFKRNLYNIILYLKYDFDPQCIIQTYL